jgi:hypothetical protein
MNTDEDKKGTGSKWGSFGCVEVIDLYELPGNFGSFGIFPIWVRLVAGWGFGERLKPVVRARGPARAPVAG